MNRVEAIALAMSAAAAAQLRPNVLAQKRPEVQAYLALKKLLAEKYPTINNDILDVGPASVERQNVLKTQLKQAGVDTDTAVLHQTRQLLQYLLQHDSKSATAVFGTTVDLQKAISILTKPLEAFEHEQ
ncbi:MAG: hypothetical protein H6654_08260 [Ardenticatenaceae bacterium]|nr:hypothetical protein [Anaerolineales bacterium]MCB8940515.1 hypothetical protein [Ardenticatenaceae bacterium]MCB8973536.1 hypothetical protein [Ardenticatenaceae bacterium]